ncbi:phage portal protein [Acinetobacter modestus]|uniref:phage portal protein n=1 Tax=Acinetobacter modestus TaxID=1776740 RepID=UPI00301AAED6
MATKNDSSTVRILDVHGNPIVQKTKALAGNEGFYSSPYDAAGYASEHTAGWQPSLGSPDGELNMYRDRIVSRARDLVRNDGWANAAVTRTLDNVIGPEFRPLSKPDYYGLQQVTGVKGFDHEWAEEFGRAVDAYWRLWANDVNRYCDVERCLTVSQMIYLAFRHKIIDGDSLAYLKWCPEKVGYGKAYFATTIQVIDPDRLSNPNYQFDQRYLRGGVEINDDGAPIAYHIRKAHQGDWFNADKSVEWDRIEKETDWGRPIIVHDFDHDRASQHRGGNGILTPVLERLKMLIKYDGTELDAAIVNAIFGAYITSPFDQGLVEEAMGGFGDDAAGGLMAYQNFRADYHASSRTKLGGVRMPILAPGESINTVSAQRPNSNFASFESAVLRNVAAGTGMSAQQISQNWSEVNYSSYRAAMLEAWKTFNRRRSFFSTGFCQPLFSAWLEEAFEIGNLPLPAGAPDFVQYRSLYGRCKWMGPGRGYVDDVKEKQGAILGMDAGLTTLEKEAAQLDGADYREILDQRANEVRMFKERDLPLPKWTGEGEASDPPAKQQTSLPEAD